MAGVSSAAEVRFDHFDRDNNGAVSKQEFITHLFTPQPESFSARIFNKADLENDGELDRSEFQRALRLRQGGVTRGGE